MFRLWCCRLNKLRTDIPKEVYIDMHRTPFGDGAVIVDPVEWQKILDDVESGNYE